jgi:hypothetical protein
MEAFINWLLSLFKESKSKNPKVPKAEPKPVKLPEGMLTREQFDQLDTDIISGKIKVKGFAKNGYDGWREIGDNKNPADISPAIVRQGGKPGHAYCMYGQQDLFEAMLTHLGISRKLARLPRGGSTQSVWADCPGEFKLQYPVVQSLCIVQYNGEWKGHVEKVKKVLSTALKAPFKVFMFAFNTNIKKPSTLVREGEGSGYVERTMNKTQKVGSNKVDLKVLSTFMLSTLTPTKNKKASKCLETYLLYGPLLQAL